MVVPLLGLWDRVADNISTSKMSLDSSALTKREILRSILRISIFTILMLHYLTELGCF